MREQRQRGRVRRQERAISRMDAGLRAENSASRGARAGSNLGGGEEREGMRDGAEVAATAEGTTAGRRVPSQVQGRGTGACEEAAAAESGRRWGGISDLR